MGVFFNDKDENENNMSSNTETAKNDRKLYSKVIDFFSTEPQREKVLRHEDFNGAGDTYYASVSAVYKIISRVVWCLLAVFLVFSIITNYREITYDRFFYLIRDFSGAVEAESTNYDTLSYDSDQNHSFSIYRGGLAVVDPSRISAFTATGRRTLDVVSDYSSPKVVCSNKYMLVYDSAGNSFSIYNSFSRVYSESFDYPVLGACFGDDGSFAVITRDSEHKSLVHYYSKNMKKLFTVPSNKLCFDVLINSSSGVLTSVYYDVGEGHGNTFIDVRKISDPYTSSEYEIKGEFPIAISYIDGDKKLAIITDHSVKIFNSKFDEIESVGFSSSYISGFFSEKSGIAVSYVFESKNYVISFDKSGNLLYNDMVSFNIRDVGVYDDYLFLQNDSGVTRINAKTKEKLELESHDGKMMVYDPKTVLVCGESKAEYLVFG